MKRFLNLLRVPKYDKLPAFHPQTILRNWAYGDAFRLADAQTGVCIFGATGSGKTSGPARHIAYGYLSNGFGGLVLCAKKEERRQWQVWAADCGRTKDLVIINAQGDYRFNFMDWEASRPGEGGGFTHNIVALLDEMAAAINNAEKNTGGDQVFWENALHVMNTNLVQLPVLAGIPVSLPLIRDIASTAPQSLEQLADEEWRQDSACWRILLEADEATKNADPQSRADFEECFTYWTRDFATLGERTRSSIMLGLTALIQAFVTSPLRRIFSSDTNITPEAAFEGKIIIVDLPVQEFRLVGRVANMVWKLCMQAAILRRVQPADRKTFLRPTWIYSDEIQNYITKGDSEFQATARSAGGCTVFITQNRESLRRALKNDDAVDSLLANLQCKFFCQNTGRTNQWAADLLGQRYVTITSANASAGLHLATQLQGNQGTQNAGISQAQDKRYYVEPAAFTTLKRGGEIFNNEVEAIVYNGGHLFPGPGGELLPYRLITFKQS